MSYSKLFFVLFACACIQPVYSMEPESSNEQETVDAIIQELTTIQQKCSEEARAHVDTTATPETHKKKLTKTIALMRELTDHLQKLSDLVHKGAPTYALTQEYARLGVFAQRVHERISSATERLSKTYGKVSRSDYAPEDLAKKYEKTSRDLDDAAQFLNCFFTGLATLDHHVAETKKELCPLQEAADGLIHVGKTVEQIGPAEYGLAPLVRSATHTGMAVFRYLLEQELEHTSNPMETPDGGAAAATTPADPISLVTLAQIAECASTIVHKHGALTHHFDTVTTFYGHHFPEFLARADTIIDYLAHAPDKVLLPPQATLTVAEFLARRKGNDFTQKRVTDIIDFLIEPPCSPTVLRVVQRLPDCCITPFVAEDDRADVVAALKNVGIQPSDIALLSYKISQQFQLTAPKRAACKEKAREWLRTATTWCASDVLDQAVRAGTTAAQTHATVATILHDPRTPAWGRTALAGLLVLEDHHEATTREEAAVIEQLRTLGKYGQTTLNYAPSSPKLDYHETKK